MTALFSATLFLGAFLLFCIEPLAAKMLLPTAGGASAVWSMCLAFFQATLLLGYVFTQLTLRRLVPRRHVWLYAVLFPAALATMPIGVKGTLGAHPVLSVIVLLAQAVGVPFFVLSTLAPAVQRWFASTGSVHARDPYFLYAASNAGSLTALLAYPFLIEPLLDLHVQAVAFEVAFLALGALLLVCALACGRSPAVTAEPMTESLTWSRRVRWVLLAAAPSAQLVAVTTYLATDIAPAPLLWTIPLAIYLLTFVLAFARRALVMRLARRLPFAVVVGVLLVVVGANEPAPVVIALHIAVLFVVAMVCHGAIAEDRPGITHLPEYYAWMSVGGALGGVATALVAPVVFKQPLEYPICFLFALACLPSRPAGSTRPRAPIWVYVIAAASVGLAFVSALVLDAFHFTSHVTIAGISGAPLLVAFAADRYPRALMWALGGILCVDATSHDARLHVVHRERSFFGAFAVTRDARETSLVHGNTTHGVELASAPRTATLYYTERGPIGDVITLAREADKTRRVALIGLGTGTLATYARPTERWRFFELDPAIVRIARDPQYFTFLADAFPSGADVVIGDARIELARDEGGYDLLVIDAFTSDSIPTHLLTREAFAMYRTKLASGALIAWHVSNRHLDLRPALAVLADDAGWVVLAREDNAEDDKTRRNASRWVAMAARPEQLAPLRAKGWADIERRAGFKLWTDERASIVTVW